MQLAYYQAKNSTTDIFLEVPRNVLKFQKSPEKLFKTVPFSLTLQSRISDFTKTDCKKNVSCDYSKLVGNLPGNTAQKMKFPN